MQLSVNVTAHPHVVVAIIQTSGVITRLGHLVGAKLQRLVSSTISRSGPVLNLRPARFLSVQIRPGTRSRDTSMSAPKRVLIVDDETKILFVLDRALTSRGSECKVVCSDSAQQALVLAQETRFDLVITDLRMSEMDGIAFTEALRTLPYDPVVIWMTAYACCTTSAEAKRLGVHCCMDKPIEVDEIRHIVREALKAAGDPS